ncbi:alpha/beta hydrolase fold domain-containing protein [Gordonia sp. VNK21]|uniref:alpha/beta hydrolase fold domain-containing protein n=1 Tax=Gordonia sp. VNK21 TaxID=3382483 RepID=UPI0038D36318
MPSLRHAASTRYIALRLRSPYPGSDDARIVYLHGGAYVRDLTPAHWKFLAGIGDRHGVEVIVPQYPLAPEARVASQHLDRLVATALT